MMGELVVRNLLHRPMRTFIGVMAVAVEVALVVLIVGLTSGMLTETAKRIEGIGADIMVQPPARFGVPGRSAARRCPSKSRARLQANEVCAVRSLRRCCNLIPRAEWKWCTASIANTFRAVSGGFVFLAGSRYGRPRRPAGGRLGGQGQKLKGR